MDQSRHVDQLDRRGGPHRAVAPLRAGAEQHQQRAQSLAAGRERRGDVGAEQLAVVFALRRSNSSTSPSLAGNQRLEASSTAVTGGGTAEGRVTRGRRCGSR